MERTSEQSASASLGLQWPALEFKTCAPQSLTQKGNSKMKNKHTISDSEINEIFSRCSNEAYITSWKARANEAEQLADRLQAQRDELLTAAKDIKQRADDGSFNAEYLGEISGLFNAIANTERKH